MAYWFDGFFLQTTDQCTLQQLIPSIKKQWPMTISRPISTPFPGLGVRMTSFTWDPFDENIEAQLAIEDELPTWSTQHPSLSFLYLRAECFGGTCLYAGYICQNGTILFNRTSHNSGIEPLRELLQQFGVTLHGMHFPPFERNFFGPDKYFRQGHVDDKLIEFIQQNT